MKRMMGFTLIELMMAISIVAILAAIAIPQYSNYTARSQLSEAIVLIGGLKTPIAEQFANDNSASSCSIPASSVTVGKYVESVTATPATPCVLVARIPSDGVSAQIAGTRVTVTYTPATGAWSCVTNAPAHLAPKACPRG
ncbi:pilin [Xanthomonas euvesicatoria]|uniref:Pilin n=1 Tax=Xanthomonas euvesicatoria TaxID=456327 RepID=A0AAX4FHK6_XANEU|nr:pilin [Xanthomonas euvesicatoria]WOP47154.1 pilin [Xanthomonas euvesicatoria]WOP53431.1 pilin [Xanthomonas euvesicatoria]WOP55661.1 pilin [Xanthomonas euvesicatoria]